MERRGSLVDARALAASKARRGACGADEESRTNVCSDDGETINHNWEWILS